MNIFDKRPLSLILCILLAGFVIFSFLESTTLKIILFAFSVLILVFFIFFPFKKFTKRRLAIVCTSIALLSSILSFLYFNLYFSIAKRYEGEVEIYGTVEEIDRYTGVCNLQVKIEEINGKRCNNTISVTLNSAEAEEIEAGTSLRLRGALEEFEKNVDFNEKSYYFAKGRSARLENPEIIEIYLETDPNLKVRLANYRTVVCNRIIRLSDEKSGGLLAALLLGEREFISAELTHDFARVGISHILALSGMHLSILTLALGRLLSVIKVRKTHRKLFEILFTVLYVCLTGFPISIVRAAIMLTLSSVLFILARQGDSLTNLLISISLICICNPYSIFDISLWLSAFATLGILILAEYEDSKITRKKPHLIIRLLKFVSFSLISSIFAILSTMILSTTTFGSISLVAPLATLVFSLIIQFYMYYGCIFIIVGGFIPLGKITVAFGNLIITFIRSISKINGIYVSAEHPLIRILIVALSILGLLFLFLKVKRKRSWILAICSSFLVLFLSAGLLSIGVYNRNFGEYYMHGSNEQMVLQSNGTSVVVDISTPSSASVNKNVSKVNDMRLTQANQYIFTDYSSRTVSAVEKLLRTIYIDEILLPNPQTEFEKQQASEILSLLTDSKSALSFYDVGDVLIFGDFLLSFTYRGTDDDNRVAFTVLRKDTFYTYISSGMLQNDTKNAALQLMNGCNTLILGRHGESYSDYNFTYKCDASELVISSKNLNIPNDILAYYENSNVYYSPESFKLYIE